jgi:S-formylglutathione hydrolase FrmB
LRLERAQRIVDGIDHRAGRAGGGAGILVDQGLADKFLPTELFPEALEAACQAAGQPLTLRRHAGYDHGYYFIATFMGDHLAHHARTLLGAGGRLA